MELKYIDKGSGQVVIFIHGFCETKELWEPYINILYKNCRIIAIDIPGFGESPKLKTAPSIDSYADSIKELIEFLKLRNIIIIGHSLGGYITLSLVDKCSENIIGFSLFHSTVFPDSEDKKSNRNKVIDFVEKNGSEAFAATLIPTLFTAENLKKYSERVNAITLTAGKTNPDGIIAATLAMRDRVDKSLTLQLFKKPVLFIIGKEDKAVLLEDSIRQLTISTNTFAYFLSETAHMGMVEKEQDCLKAISAFIFICSGKL